MPANPISPEWIRAEIEERLIEAALCEYRAEMLSQKAIHLRKLAAELTEQLRTPTSTINPIR